MYIFPADNKSRMSTRALMNTAQVRAHIRCRWPLPASTLRKRGNIVFVWVDQKTERGKCREQRGAKRKKREDGGKEGWSRKQPQLSPQTETQAGFHGAGQKRQKAGGRWERPVIYEPTAPKHHSCRSSPLASAELQPVMCSCIHHDPVFCEHMICNQAKKEQCFPLSSETIKDKRLFCFHIVEQLPF